MDCLCCPRGARERYRWIALGMPPEEAAKQAVDWLMETTQRGCVANTRMDQSVINPLTTAAIKTNMSELAYY